MKKITLISLVLLLGTGVNAQEYSGGATGLDFLKIGVGGRGAALGDAVVADDNGVDASYWNPAGLVSAGSGVTLAHSRWLQDIRNEFIATRFSGLGGALALALQVQTIGGIMVRNETPSQAPLATLDAYDLAFGLSYARRVSEQLEVGATIKMLNERILTRSANGYAFDLGFRYRMPALDKVRFGLSLNNLGRMSALREENIALPTVLRFGVSAPSVYTRKAVVLNVNLAVNHYFRETTSLAGGVEAAVLKRYFLRFGYQTGLDSQGLTAGLGLNAGRYRLDYAYVPFSYNLGSTHRFSAGIAL